MTSAQGSAMMPATVGTTGSVFNATVKGKINGLEETVRVLMDEINFYANEINGLKEEKD